MFVRLNTPKMDLTQLATKSEIPVKLSDLENDMGFLIQHQDISHLALKSELFSKSYNDLTDKPIIPSIEGLATQESVDLLQEQINTLMLNYEDLLDKYKTLLKMINNLNAYEQAIVGISKVGQSIIGKKGE